MTKAEAVEGGWLVTDARGDQHRVSKVAWELAVEGTPAAIMPALPGTYLVGPGEDESGKPKVWKNNVLGWMIGADTEVRPVVIDMSLISDGWQVLHPDGRVEQSNGDTWDSVEEWLSQIQDVREAA